MTTIRKGSRRQRTSSTTVATTVVIGAIAFTVFLGFCASISLLRRYDAFSEQQQQMAMLAMQPPGKKFTPVPAKSVKTFKYDGSAISRPMVRALRSRGWQLVNNEEDAHIIFRYSTTARLFKELKPWQRFNNIPQYKLWNQKDSFVDVFKAYEARNRLEPTYFLPESYRLTSPQEQKAFKKRITQDGGINQPWVLKQPRVNQGKGIEMVAPNSERLVEVAHFELQDDDTEYIVQQYICNENTWNHRKYDVRMFWFVASLDPLIVMYQDGYVRIGNSEYTEEDFDNTVGHLTTHTGLGEEGKATYSQFVEHIQQHYESSPHLRKMIRDPVQHVRNQFKDSLAEFVEAFRDVSFEAGLRELSAENGFGFYGADFILDNDLDVWLIEPQKGCGMDEDYDFRVTMHDRLFRGMVDTLEEVWQKQEAGEQLLPLENTGDWEIIYAHGWKYKYQGYQRSKKKNGCQLSKKVKRMSGDHQASNSSQKATS